MDTSIGAITSRSTTNRSKLTDPLKSLQGRDGRTAQGRRRRDLIGIFLNALGGPDAVSELQLVEVRKAAELTVTAETVRARVLAGDATIPLDGLVRLEGEARRAIRGLGIKSGPTKRGPTLAEYLKEGDG